MFRIVRTRTPIASIVSFSAVGLASTGCNNYMIHHQINGAITN
jgi:hypothetical protein